MKKENIDHSDYEKKAKKMIKKGYLIGLIGLGSLFAICFGLKALPISLDVAGRIAFLLVISLVIIIGLLMYKIRLDVDAEYKKEFFLKKLSSTFSNVKYDYRKGLGESRIKTIDMIGIGNSFSSNKYFSAKYKTINFEYAFINNVCVKRFLFGSEETRRNVFSGHWFILGCGKKFETKVCIKANNVVDREKGLLSYKTNFNNVDIGNSVLDSCFKTFVEDESKKDIVLTSSMQKKILKLMSLSDQLIIVFCENEMHIGISPVLNEQDVVDIFRSSDDDIAWKDINFIKNVLDIIIEDEE